MQIGTRLPISLAIKIYKIHMQYRTTNRGFAIKDGFVKSTPFEFNYAAYNPKDKDDMWRMNIELHEAMNSYWDDTIGDDAAQDAFGRWVIQSWGGIRTNSEKTLQRYMYEAKKFRDTNGKKGVSSFSKLMAAKDSTRNFILDARVAVALNILQLEYFAGRRYFFDVLGTQNTKISNFNKIYNSKKYRAIGYEPFKNDMYAFYNELIKKMAAHLGVRGIEVEMMLFDNAENIIADLTAVESKYQKNLDYWQERLKDWDKRKKKRHTERLKSQGDKSLV